MTTTTGVGRQGGWSTTSRGLLLYAQTRRLDGALLATVLSAVAVGLSAGLVLRVPFAPELVVVQAHLLAPVVPAVVLAGTLAAPLAALEDVAADRLRRLRGVHVFLMVVALAVPLAIAGVSGTAEWLPLVRNALALLGAGLLFAVLVGPDLAWLAVVVPAAVCFLLGKRHDDGAVHPWAWLLQDASSASALQVSLLLLVAGALLFVAKGPARR